MPCQVHVRRLEGACLVPAVVRVHYGPLSYELFCTIDSASRVLS